MVGRTATRPINGAVNIPQANGNYDPPPSTLAAQLVREHAAPVIPTSTTNNSTATFGHLLQEILNNLEAPETDADVNYKLIRVVAEAGLDVVSQDNPFAQWDALLPQAEDSLEVIESTIKRQPELLFLGTSGAGSSNPVPHLLLWLLPKILRLAIHPKCDSLKDRISSLLAEVVSSLAKTLDWWRHGEAILTIYNECVEDVVGAVTCSSELRLDLVLPPARSISNLTSSEDGFVTMPAGSQLHVQNYSSAFRASFVLLLGLQKVIHSVSASSSLTMDVPSQHHRCLDATVRLTYNLLRVRQQCESQDDFSGLCELSVHTLSAICLPYGSRSSSLPPEKTLAMLSGCAASFLGSHISNALPVRAQETTAILLDKISSLAAMPNPLQNMAELLSNNLETISSRLDQWSRCCSTLQRSLRGCWTNLRLFSETKMPRLPDNDVGVGAHEDVDMQDVHDSTPRATMHSISEYPAIRRNLRIEAQSNVAVLSAETAYTVLLEKINHYLSRTQASDLIGTAGVAQNAYTSLASSEQDALWALLAVFPCAATGMLRRNTCSYCQFTPHLKQSLDSWETSGRAEDCAEFLASLDRLLQLPEIQHSTQRRIGVMLVIRSYVMHTRDGDHLSLEKSILGEWCLRALNSSSRELRLAASHTLVAFLRAGLPDQVQTANRRLALEYLRSLTDRASISHHDTLISAWGKVAVTCGEKELNLALLALVNYLGHSNTFVCALACSELERVADSLDQTPDALLAPFWKSIAVAAVQDLVSNPQKVQNLAEFLGTSVNQFLVFTERYTLPTLILTKKRDVLIRLAAARGPSTKVQDICLKPSTNLAAILALLISQPSNDTEAFVEAVLSESVPDLAKCDLPNLVRIDAVKIVIEMLKITGDEDVGRKPRMYQAVQMLALLVEKKTGQSKASAKPSRMLASFFESQVLGIMTQFSDSIEKTDGSVPVSEKRRCLKAIEEMVNVARSHITIAVPQIRACLQSAIDQEGVLDEAISAWLTLMRTLEGEDIVHLLDHLFALVVQHWSMLSASIQQKTYDTIAHVLKTHSNIIREEVITVPSLAGIPLMSKFEAEITRLKEHRSQVVHLDAFAQRLQDENASIVQQAAEELLVWLEINQSFVHESAVSEPPAPVVSTISRALLDACVKYNSDKYSIPELCARCLGIIGCLDPNRIEATTSRRRMLILSNFDKASEVVDWVAVLFEDVMVPAFQSTNNARAQGFLAYVMQELLRFSNFNEVALVRLRASQSSEVYQKWIEMPENVRNILTPFLTSRYALTSNYIKQPQQYPIFKPSSVGHSAWLRAWTFDLLHNAKGDNAAMLFPTLARVIKNHDLSIATFLLPYAALNIVVGGTVREVEEVAQEMLVILSTESTVSSEIDTLRQCSENVFSVLDYMSRWAQEKKRTMAHARVMAIRAGHSPDDFEEAKHLGVIDSVERVVASIPADIMAQRAIECGSYARALFHWEQYIRDQKARALESPENRDAMYQRLQTIYSQIDEPDGLDGIAAQLNILSPEQQAIQHRRAGRWSAAQSWYDIESMQKPSDQKIQLGLLSCLREAGQYNQVIRLASSLTPAHDTTPSVISYKRQLLSFTAEACWMTENLPGLTDRLADCSPDDLADFNLSMGHVLMNLRHKNEDAVKLRISSMRSTVVKSMSMANASSLQSCHGALLNLHAIYEVERLSQIPGQDSTSFNRLMDIFDQRLAVLGSYVSDKQYILGVRRAVMRALSGDGPNIEVGSSWLTTARLARKANISGIAHYAVLRAGQCGDDSAKIEQARLLWRDGQRRQAIHSLEGAIASNAFASYERRAENSNPEETQSLQNALSARAQLLLAKWLDTSGQTQAHMITTKYQFAARHYPRWEKGHYYLGKHYNKLLEADKALPAAKRSEAFTSGETTKLVIENYLRSVPFGTKYWFQTIPKLLTLWLDLGMDCVTKPRDLSTEVFDRRKKHLELIHRQLKKYFDRIPSYIFYASLPQMISRISHPHEKVAELLSTIIQKIVTTYPSQGLWALLPVGKATSQERAKRGLEIINKLRGSKSGTKSDTAGIDLRTMVIQGQKLQDGLLQACDIHLEGRTTTVSLSRDLGFSHKLAPNPLVVPFQFALTPNVPTVQDASNIRHFKAFAQDKVTIASFSDEVLVLNSLQRPRKLSVRGSDGKLYGLLCKPKDDLRKDQRLMEFNTMINRALKRDTESSKRRLYIKTYGVTPLSEESGTIEWVEGIKPLRDILLKLYQRKGIQPNYTELRSLLNEACLDGANLPIFADKILPIFPPTLHEWFVEIYPEPDIWFSARLRYARSAAVMSMVGHVLGLGDRHGENILLEESTGGVFHVDFNCLFDKGLTFEKPELVPFRLTHNMVDALGCYGYEGPFRKSSELTLGLLRQHQDTLMNILETFVHDPTTDFIGKKKRTTPGVPDTPQEVLDSVLGKLRGYLRGESVPLSVEGHVDALVKQATDPWNLCRMYIGWCAFL